MKNKKIKFSFYALCLILVLSTNGCNDAELSTLSNQLYIAETGTSANIFKKVTIDEEGATVLATARVSNPTEQDVKVRFIVDPLILEKFNKRNSTSYAALPDTHYNLAKNEIVIKKGESIAPAINIGIEALSEELINSGNQFALAVKIELIEDSNVSILDGANSIVYIVDQVIISSVPVLGTDPQTGYHSAVAALDNDIQLDEWTVEMRINMNGFRRNNQALFGAWGSDESPSELYMRFGDAGTPYNTLQVKFGLEGSGNAFSRSNTIFEPNKWYHIAVTYDGTTITLYVNGVKDIDTDNLQGKKTTFSEKITLSGAGASWFVNSCMMQEVRVWNECRTQQEIANNQYTISPKSNGLLMYWKMNEGEGSTLNNSVEGASDLEIIGSSPVRWLDNVRSDDKGRISLD